MSLRSRLPADVTGNLAALFLGSALSFAAEVAVPRVTIQGTVRDAADSSPIAGANVFAVAGQPPAVVASTTTDPEGRYRLETSAPRFELSLTAGGYFVARAGHAEAELIARVCPDAGDCGEADFLLSRATVLEGWITDAFGNPMQSIEIELERSQSNQAEQANQRPLFSYTQERNRNERGVTDDRGYFRMWGLRPGEYTLTTERGGTGYSGIPEPPQLTRVVRIPEGGESVRLNLQLTDAPQAFSFSGEIEDLAPNDTRWLTLEPVSGGDREYIQVLDRKFSSSSVLGEYVVRLEQVVNADPAASQADYLATLNVNRDLRDLRLRPQTPTGVRARVAYVDSPPIPFYLLLRQRDRPKAPARRIAFDGAATEIERSGLLPGDYISWVQAGSYFMLDKPPITIVPGQMTEVEFRLSNQRSTIRGTVRSADKTPTANIVVGVRGRNTRSTLSDNEGGFVFERLIPGEYEIAAWNCPMVDVADDEVWRQAGESLKRIQVEPGFEVDVDLTIAP